MPLFTSVALYLGYSVVLLSFLHVSLHDIISGSAAMPCWQNQTIWWAGEELKELPPVYSLNDAWHITNNICVSSLHRMDIVEHYKTTQESTVL